MQSPKMDKLLMSNIRTLNIALRESATTVTEVIQSCLNRINSTQKFNAFVSIKDAQCLLEDAAECDRRTKQKERLSHLDGVPIAIKDNLCTKDFPTTCASMMLKDFRPPYNATACQRLIDAGAVALGKTNLDEFAMGSGTVDSIHGPSKNPWGYKNEEDFRITGGSSGGSAVSVLLGTCFAALGSDTGGSVRNPASYCGVVGLKPTYGLISRHGLIPLVNSMDCVGILTRNVDDCVDILNVIAGPDEKDSTCLGRHFKKVRLAKDVTVKGLKIGIPKEYRCEYLADDVLETWKVVADILEASGAVVKEVSMPNTKYSIVCYSILNQCEVSSNMSCYDGIEYGYRACEINDSHEKLLAESRYVGFNDVVKARIISGNYFLLQRNYEKYFNQALKVRRLIANDFDNVFEDVEILLTPMTLSTAVSYEDFVVKSNREQCAIQDFCTQPSNMSGVPAINIPITLSKDGLPICLQLMSANLNEQKLLTVAKFIENVVEFSQNYEQLKM